MSEHVLIDEHLVQGLIDSQFPQWSNLALKPVNSHGTDNAIFRLGRDMCVRLPKITWAAHDAAKEQKVLSKLGPLHLATSTPLAFGEPENGYPWHWSIFNWLDGENAYDNKIVDLDQAASSLADFLHALRRVDSEGALSSRRGEPLQTQDQEVKNALDSLDGLMDTDRACALWKKCLKTPEWQGAPTWLHGDLLPGNLLVNDGQLTGVIDWGLAGVGDPACDLIIAYSLLDSSSRKLFRTLINVDSSTWMRAMGWALSISLIILPYYWHSNPRLVSIAQRMIKEVFEEADHI